MTGDSPAGPLVHTQRAWTSEAITAHPTGPVPPALWISTRGPRRTPQMKPPSSAVPAATVHPGHRRMASRILAGDVAPGRITTSASSAAAPDEPGSSSLKQVWVSTTSAVVVTNSTATVVSTRHTAIVVPVGHTAWGSGSGSVTGTVAGWLSRNSL